VVERQFIVVLGPAGSGKTTLTASFGRWVEEKQGLSVGYVNLDPGADILPYKADFDIRRYVNVRDVMKKYGLGPNGAFIKCADLMLEDLERIIAGIDSVKSEYVIVDTPGQMELFVFRRSGPTIIDGLRSLGFPIAVVVFDPSLAGSPVDIAALKLMTTVVQLRLNVDSVPVLNKVDLPSSSEVAKVLESSKDLLEALRYEEGLSADLAQALMTVLEDYRQASRLVKVSALQGTGLEELYDILHEVYCTCGDLT